MLCRIYMFREVLNNFFYFGFEFIDNLFFFILSNIKIILIVIIMTLLFIEGDDLGLG